MIDTQEIASAKPAWLENETVFEKVVKICTFAVILFVIVYPFFSVVATSLASDQDVIKNGGLVIWPENPTLNSYRTIFAGGVVTRAAVVSVAITVIGTLTSLALTIGMAYGLSRRIVGGKWILILALTTLLFTPGIIPNYLAVKQYGLLNTYASLILPVVISAFNLVVMRQFFMGIPTELIDSAKIDGANDWDVLVKIMLPLSKAVLAVIALFYAVNTYWNAFFNALLYLNDSAMWPLQLVLRLYVVQASFSHGMTPPGRRSRLAWLTKA